MENQKEKTANEEEHAIWQECPICLRGNARSPQFKEFLPLVNHMEEHLASPEASYVLYESLRREGVLAAQNPSKQKFAANAKPLLLTVAYWLQETLAAFPEINAIRTSDVLVADQLVELASRLPDRFKEQREYLLRQEDKLRDTGMDPRWPRKLGRQIGFIAESLAGAHWDLSPSTSREFIRQQKPRRGAIPVVEQRWWEQPTVGSEESQE